MRELAILTFVTLDGVMQSPSGPDEDPSGGFKHGGWARPCWDDVMQQVQREAMAAPYDLLLGRKTYDIFASHFPKSDASNPMNDATKYVATSTDQSSLEWTNSVRITGDIAVEVDRLKKKDGPLLQVHGSSQLIQTLLVHGLIDEYRIWTFPVVVGAGKRLFGEGIAQARLTLTKSEPCSSGAMMSIYRNEDNT